MDINYYDKTLTIGDLKARLAYLVERGANVEPDENEEDTAIWDEHEEWKNLDSLDAELHWVWDQDSVTLINERHWQEYCQETCYDLGDCQRGGVVDGCVDWDKVADSMRQDYKHVALPDSEYFYVRG